MTQMQIINRDSFEATEIEQKGSYAIERGTVEATLGNETRRVRASKIVDRIVAYDMGGRYVSGGKVWPAHAASQLNERTAQYVEYVDFGRDDRSGKFNKRQAVFFTGGEKI